MCKKLLGTFLALIMLVAFFTGCGGNGGSPAPAQSEAAGTAVSSDTLATPQQSEGAELEPVTLKWYVVGTPQDDQTTVFAEANKTFQEKLNTTVGIDIIDWGSFDEKLKMAIATGEEFDMCFTSSWANPYVSSAQKGAFVALDELLPVYGQNILAQVPEHYWDAVKIKGEIYAVANYQITAIQRGVSFPKDIAEKYNLDTGAIKKMADLTPYFETIKENEPDMVPFLGMGTGGVANMPELCDFEAGFIIDYVQGNSNIPIAIRVNDDSLTVFNAVESDEFMEYCKMARDWYEKGYVRKDAASIQDGKAEVRSGKYAAFGTGVGPGSAEGEGEIAGFPIVQAATVPPYVNTGSIQAALTAISKTSKNPERAMMVLDLLFEDKELYNTLCYGIEDVHYTKISDITLKTADDSGYNPGIAWVFGSWFNAMLLEGQSADLWDQIKVINETANTSGLLGFVYDSENVKNEYAQISALMSEYLPGLLTGSLNPEEKIPELLGRMKSAGIDAMIDDANAQIVAWRK